MLVISRKKDESLIIGVGEHKIEVSVSDIRGNKVRIGVTAPADVSIHRQEVFAAIQKEKRRES